MMTLLLGQDPIFVDDFTWVKDPVFRDELT